MQKNHFIGRGCSVYIPSKKVKAEPVLSPETIAANTAAQKAAAERYRALMIQKGLIR